MEIVQLSTALGHCVLFTLPYHSNLKPIELLWALIKGNIARQYSTETILKIVYRRLMEEFTKMEENGHKTINEMMKKCASIAKKFFDNMERYNIEDLD